jgi:hypothetical protein
MARGFGVGWKNGKETLNFKTSFTLFTSCLDWKVRLSWFTLRHTGAETCSSWYVINDVSQNAYDILILVKLRGSLKFYTQNSNSSETLVLTTKIYGVTFQNTVNMISRKVSSSPSMCLRKCKVPHNFVPDLSKSIPCLLTCITDIKDGEFR